MSLYAICIKTILTIPLFNIIIANLICNSSIYQIIFNYHKILIYTKILPAIREFIYLIFFLQYLVYLFEYIVTNFSKFYIGALISFPLIIIFEFYIIDLNPFSTIPFAQAANYTNLYRVVIKFFLPFLTMFSYQVKIYL